MTNAKSSADAYLSAAERDGAEVEYRISVTLSVGNVGRLWAAAAAKALGMPDMTLEDVLDLLGPREDPEIAECLAMLTAPAAVAGCALGDFSVERVAPAAPLLADARRLAGRRPPAAALAGGLTPGVARSAVGAAFGIYEVETGPSRRLASVPTSRLN